MSVTTVPSILEKIVDHKRREVAERRETWPHIALASLPPVRKFMRALEGAEVRLIAEVKQGSPSRGVMREDFDPVALADAYAKNGAACVSVLTDEEFFHGHDYHLIQVHAAVPLPILRKEFIIDRWQIVQSRSLGADAVLLIAAILSDEDLTGFQECAHELGMAALVEVHTEREMERALAIDAPLIGINNRDLNTFETDLETTERLAEMAREDGERILVSESGIFTTEDVTRVAAAGVDAILVGEALVREQNPGAKVRELSCVPRTGR